MIALLLERLLQEQKELLYMFVCVYIKASSVDLFEYSYDELAFGVKR